MILNVSFSAGYNCTEVKRIQKIFHSCINIIFENITCVFINCIKIMSLITNPEKVFTVQQFTSFNFYPGNEELSDRIK